MRTITKVLGAAILSLGILVTGCEPGDGQIMQDFDRSGEEMRITVVFHDSHEALNRYYRERFGRENTEEKLGFAVWADPGRQPYWCEVHTTRPKRADDEPMETMGHELAHCVFGHFHPQ